MKKPTKKAKISNSELKLEVSPALKSLIGVLKLPKDYDFKEDRTEFLEKKYCKL